MTRLAVCCCAFSVLFCSIAAAAERGAAPARTTAESAATAADWPWWRGPHRNGHADPNQQPPLQWGAEKNVVWKAEIPGRGHGSPTVVREHGYLATADEQAGVQSVLCYDRGSGKRLWKTNVHRGGLMKKKLNKKASHASSTVACDGERLFINFPHGGAVYTTAVSRQGKILWQKKITDYTIHQGFGSSPAIYKSLVIVSADNKGGGAIAGLDRATGDVAWRRERPKTPNYSSPVIHRIGGRDQLIMTGCDLVASYDPATGKELWKIRGATTECVTTTVSDGERVFSTGGYPKNHMAAIRADGSGEIDWENGTRVYVPSLLEQGGYLFAVTDAGVALCLRSSNGQEQWKARLGGTFSSSPVLVGELIFATNESGETFIYRADSKRFKLVGKNELGDEVFATPVFLGGRIYHRIAVRENGKRQEYLVCLGERR